MIIFTIALFLALISIIYVILRMTNRVPPISDALESTALICATLSFAAVLIMSSISLISLAQARTNFDKYETLILYRDVVENSHDELLRWDFYERVEDWNTRYEANLKGSNNPWYSMLFPAKAYEGCDFVAFELRRS